MLRQFGAIMNDEFVKPQYANKNNADLIVVLTDHESELNNSLLGALAKQMVNHSKVPVLSIKPKAGNYTSFTQFN